MKTTLVGFLFCLAAVVCLAFAGSPADRFTDTFDIGKADLSPTGRNRYCVLEPGYQLVLEG